MKRRLEAYLAIAFAICWAAVALRSEPENRPIEKNKLPPGAQQEIASVVSEINRIETEIAG
jgi:hypothetical protein